MRIEASFEPSLLPGTTYYYRTIASNRDGTGYGPLRSFVTGAFAEPPSPTTTSLLSFPTTPPPTITTKSTEKPTRAQKLVSAQGVQAAEAQAQTCGLREAGPHQIRNYQEQAKEPLDHSEARLMSVRIPAAKRMPRLDSRRSWRRCSWRPASRC